jgi:hypothetical protein
MHCVGFNALRGIRWEYRVRARAARERLCACVRVCAWRVRASAQSSQAQFVKNSMRTFGHGDDLDSCSQ